MPDRLIELRQKTVSKSRSVLLAFSGVLLLYRGRSLPRLASSALPAMYFRITRSRVSEMWPVDRINVTTEIRSLTCSSAGNSNVITAGRQTLLCLHTSDFLPPNSEQKSCFFFFFFFKEGRTLKSCKFWFQTTKKRAQRINLGVFSSREVIYFSRSDQHAAIKTNMSANAACVKLAKQIKNLSEGFFKQSSSP